MLAPNMLVSLSRYPQVALRRFGFLKGKSLVFRFSSTFAQQFHLKRFLGFYPSSLKTLRQERDLSDLLQPQVTPL